MLDAWEKGLTPKPPDPTGEANPCAVLTEADVREIRRRFGRGERQTDNARDYPVSHFQVWRIVHRKAWRYVA